MGDSPGLTDRFASLSREMGLDRSQMGRLAGVSPRTLARQLRRQATPRAETLDRIRGVVEVLESPAAVMRADPARDWLFTPNLFLGTRPAESIAGGSYHRVMGAIAALGEGVFI